MENKRIVKALDSLTAKDRGFVMENIMVEHDGDSKRTMTATTGTLLLSAEFEDTGHDKPLKGFLNELTGKIHASELTHPNWRDVCDAGTDAPSFTVSLDELEKMVKALKCAVGERSRKDMIGIEFRVSAPNEPVNLRVCDNDIPKTRDECAVKVNKINGTIMTLRDCSWKLFQRTT